MGQDKAWLEVEGQALIERTLDLLAPLFDEAVVVANSDDRYTELAARRGLRLVADPPQFAGMGPLAGLLAGMDAALNDVIFLAACDLPFASPCLAGLLLRRLQPGHDAAVPRTSDGSHPLFAAYRKSLRSEVERLLREQRLRIDLLFDDRATAWLDEEEMRPCGDPAVLLFNMNSPAEYEEALRKTHRL